MKIFVTSHAEQRWHQRTRRVCLIRTLFDIFANHSAVEILEKKPECRVDNTHKLWHAESKTLLLFTDTMETLVSVNCTNRKYLKPRRTQVWLRKLKEMEKENKNV